MSGGKVAKGQKEGGYVTDRPKTTEDFIVEAIELGGLEEVVKLLRDWHGSKEIRRCLNKLSHRDPTDRFTHARRHAVEIYARRHGLTPANLMVNIAGKQARKDPWGSERYKLRKAREFLKNDKAALIGAQSLADHWDKIGPGGNTHEVFLRDITSKFTFK